MLRNHALIRGAFILTLSGAATRFIGFFYRMFLGRAFGGESVGLYQLAFPVYALCFSVCAAGVETAISRSTAAGLAARDPLRVRAAFQSGLSLSVLLSFAALFFVQGNAGFLAGQLLGDPRCAPLLCVLILALPFACVHACICGHCLGRKSTRLPALSQLLEQAGRVGSVVLLFHILDSRGIRPGIALAAGGIVAAEASAAFYCLVRMRGKGSGSRGILSFTAYKKGLGEILSTAVPLTGNRVLLNILQSVEAVSIPLKLQAAGLTAGGALTVYGALTGMALPCILFPSALTSSVSAMLLPAAAQIQASGDRRAMQEIVRNVFFSCFSLGLFFGLLMAAGGNMLGQLLFHSRMAGRLIATLAWMCPFLYTNSCLLSILNGLGKTHLTFLFNAAGLLLRIGSVFLLVPAFGIRGYLWGLLAGQGAVFALCFFTLYPKLPFFRPSSRYSP